MAQKACDGKPYLRSGAAETAVPPAGMTNLPWFSSATKCNFGIQAKFWFGSEGCDRKSGGEPPHSKALCPRWKHRGCESHFASWKIHVDSGL